MGSRTSSEAVDRIHDGDYATVGDDDESQHRCQSCGKAMKTKQKSSLRANCKKCAKQQSSPRITSADE